MYIDDFRGINEDSDYIEDFENTEEYPDFQNFEEFEDRNYIYNLEIEDLPFDCPYRHMAPPPPNFQGMGHQGPQGSQGFPKSAPPNFTPPTPSSNFGLSGGPSVKAVDPGAIRPCTFRFVYIWPRRGRGFWAWLTFVGPRSASGFRWNGFRWVYFGIDLRSIDRFQCY
jgi:hypothetical protein